MLTYSCFKNEAHGEIYNSIQIEIQRFLFVLEYTRRLGPAIHVNIEEVVSRIKYRAYEIRGLVQAFTLFKVVAMWVVVSRNRKGNS